MTDLPAMPKGLIEKSIKPLSSADRMVHFLHAYIGLLSPIGRAMVAELRRSHPELPLHVIEHGAMLRLAMMSIHGGPKRDGLESAAQHLLRMQEPGSDRSEGAHETVMQGLAAAAFTLSGTTAPGPNPYV